MSSRIVPWWVPALANCLYAALLVFLALVPSLPGSTPPISDSVAHGLAYGIQAGLLAWALGRRLSHGGGVVLAWLGATATGMATELLQRFQPARSLELRDLVADMLGAGIVVLLLLLLPRCRFMCWLRLG